VSKHDDSILTKYDYDENGFRTKKIVGNTQTDFFYSNGKLIGEALRNLETKKITEIHEFLYDDKGLPLPFIQTVFSTDGTKMTSIYNYLTNYRGDVIKIIDKSGQSVANYSYDAFGNVLSQNGTLADLNPIRYAGYYYDNEVAHYMLLVSFPFAQVS
jgi:YD repeat-containing protein